MWNSRRSSFRHEDLPAVYIQVARLDPLQDSGLLYERVLRVAGGSTRLDMYVCHFIYNVSGGVSD
ncbi:hypothetical protein B0H11DRAFT_1703004 [Mycena galericulata]|nr:hypothetical protein B0H11DRAFT_1703004 [Mycena galericulata]